MMMMVTKKNDPNRKSKFEEIFLLAIRHMHGDTFLLMIRWTHVCDTCDISEKFFFKKKIFSHQFFWFCCYRSTPTMMKNTYRFSGFFCLFGFFREQRHKKKKKKLEFCCFDRWWWESFSSNVDDLFFAIFERKTIENRDNKQTNTQSNHLNDDDDDDLPKMKNKTKQKKNQFSSQTHTHNDSWLIIWMMIISDDDGYIKIKMKNKKTKQNMYSLFLQTVNFVFFLQ